MSSLNSRRQVGHGVGGGNASIDNMPFCVPGGWAGWISNEEAFIANGEDGWVAAIFNQRTGLIRRAIDDPAHPQYGASLNSGYAGGGIWAAWLGSQDAQRGLYTSTGLHLPEAGLLAIGPSGELGFKPEYQSAGPSMVLEWAGQLRVAAAGGDQPAYERLEAALKAEGLLWPLSASSCYDLQLLGGQRAIWQEGNRILAAGLPRPLQIGRAWHPLAFQIGGRWWVSYFSDVAGIVLHPFDELVGLTIVPPGVDCWYSARSYGDEVSFALFSFEAEQNGQLHEPLTTVNPLTAPLSPLQPPAEPFVLPAPTRKYWAGWFEFASSPQGPGNAVLAVRNIAGALDRPAIVTHETEHLVSSQTLGRFIDGTTVDAIGAAARDSALRPIAYWDDNAWPRWPSLPKGAWLCIRCYCAVAQSVDDWKAEARRHIASAPAGVPLVLVVQQYTSNASLVGYVDPSTPPPHDSAALKPLAQGAVALANESLSVVAVFLFSGYGRRGGLMDHPDLVDGWTQWCAQLHAPALEPYPPSVPVPPQPVKIYYHAKEYQIMAAEEVGAVKVADIFGRVVAAGAGKGPFGWYQVLFDRSTPDDDCWWTLSKPDNRFALQHTKVPCLLGADQKEAEDPFWYGKPLSEPSGRGILESPVLIFDPVAAGLIVGYFTWPNRHPTGGTASPSFAWIKRAS